MSAFQMPSQFVDIFRCIIYLNAIDNPSIVLFLDIATAPLFTIQQLFFIFVYFCPYSSNRPTKSRFLTLLTLSIFIVTV